MKKKIVVHSLMLGALFACEPEKATRRTGEAPPSPPPSETTTNSLAGNPPPTNSTSNSSTTTDSKPVATDANPNVAVIRSNTPTYFKAVTSSISALSESQKQTTPFCYINSGVSFKVQFVDFVNIDGTNHYKVKIVTLPDWARYEADFKAGKGQKAMLNNNVNMCTAPTEPIYIFSKHFCIVDKDTAVGADVKVRMSMNYSSQGC